ncbi:glycoside hydrolase family 38 C-terminal domain-containing protein [Enterococcus rivorum]|uniref:Alpha-mannosidase n=1 Tax=Enterococcus rivorum TaxID=762845 RepID=A0A1E5KYM7_9ENTE|nr:glycoside hydrolase family 38 C-terminal domain-containing protein [Enterococcus rivorum]MBP2097510.1 mannosylglycerate hydrolase [Enterococcus rivorum]OEH82967.1 alpha-mannosidase [Enterococcus rivorum]
MKKKVHVIHHTHWDFEWYFTTNESFIQLAYHMDEVMNALETNQIDFYLLDGQMSILDEYLQCFPEQKERIKDLVVEGRLKIGPWYTQTDELIVSGESIVRNLNLGMDLANNLGGYMNIGYLPDSFGQSKDMPKIYNGLGINHAVFWRGVPNDVTTDREFDWFSEDGSKVTVSNIKNGYFVGVGLITDDNYQSLMNIIENGATNQQLVLPVGGDQRYVDFNLRERIDRYNENLPEYELVESSYEQFFKEIQNYPLVEVQGEFISSSVSKIHRSIYSSRYDHKYLHDQVERRMIYQVEPLMTLAEKWGIPYKQGALDRIWKLLNKSQAHDSAGGCNSDATNKIILDRLIEADQLSASIIDYLTRKIAESRVDAQQNKLTLFNTLPWGTKKIVTVAISSEHHEVSIQKEGVSLPIEVLQTVKEYNGSIKRNVTEMDQSQFYYIHTIMFEAEIPALGFTSYQICNKETIVPTNKKTEPNIENSHYQIFLVNGQLCLKEKQSGQLHKNFLKIEDSGDEGDTYDYSPPYEDDQYNLYFDEAEIAVQANRLQSRMKLSGQWLIAKNLDERQRKIRTQLVPYTFTIVLQKESEQIQCHLEIQNTAYNHRMRAVIQVPYENQFSYTDTPFGTIKRVVEDPHINDWKALNWREEPTTIFPMLHYVNTHNHEKSVTLFTKGIKEYQLIGEKYNQMALTLFRSVGYLGRPDLLRRPGVASGNEFKLIPTPDSQLLQTLTFEFAIQLEKKYNPAKLMRNYLNYAVAQPYYQIQELNRFTTKLKYFVSNLLPEKIDPKAEMTLQSENLVFSSLRKAVKAEGSEVRLYNPSDTQTTQGGKIILSKEQQYEYVDLKGMPLNRREVGQEIILGEFKPGEIKTIRII